jgi:replication factor C subunit 2/4
LDSERELNDASRIIEPLASRCSKFRFKPLDTSSSSIRLQHIAQQEQLAVSPDVIEALITASQGDLRRAITYLQSAARLKQSDINGSPISATDVHEIAGVVPDHVINGFASTLGIEVSTYDMDIDDSSWKHAKGFDAIRRKVRGLMREGYSAAQLLMQVRRFSPSWRTKHSPLVFI